MLINTSASLLPHALITGSGIPSGPAALCQFTLFREDLTSEGRGTWPSGGGRVLMGVSVLSLSKLA